MAIVKANAYGHGAVPVRVRWKRPRWRSSASRSWRRGSSSETPASGRPTLVLGGAYDGGTTHSWSTRSPRGVSR